MAYRHTKLAIICMVVFIILPLMFIHASKILITGETFFPVESAEVLNNPYMGWAPSAEGGPYDHAHRLVYVNVTWRELEPNKGEYAFEDFEKKYKFSYWREKNIHIIFRLNMDFPSKEKHLDIPDWLFEEIGGDGAWYDLDYGKGFSPNYSNPILISYHKSLMEALGQRYNDDAQIPIVALGSLGHWGEWHTKQDQPFPISFPSIEASDKYVEHYLQSFTNKYLVMRRPFSIAKKNKIGLYNDSFGDPVQTYDYFIKSIKNGYYDYMADMEQPAMPDYWKHAPSGGEIANPPGITCFEEDYIKTTLEQIRECHTSWLGPSCPAYYTVGSELQGSYNLMLRTMGYRLVLHSLKHNRRVDTGSTLSMEMLWQNKGVAPFYYPWPLEVSLADEGSDIIFKTILSEDIRSWLPGSKSVKASILIPSDLKPGNYIICVAILDPATGEPSIELAIDNKRSDGRYSLDQVIVAKKAD